MYSPDPPRDEESEITDTTVLVGVQDLDYDPNAESEPCFACETHPNNRAAESFLKLFDTFCTRLAPCKEFREIGIAVRQAMDSVPDYRNIQWSAESIARHIEHHGPSEDLYLGVIQRRYRAIMNHTYRHMGNPTTKEIDKDQFKIFRESATEYRKGCTKRGGGSSGKQQNVFA